MKDYFPEKWCKILQHNNLDSFESLWAHEAEWFEEPNERRGGWSGVCRFDLNLPEGGTVGVFRKTQQNHITRTFSHPFGMPTFVREFKVLLRFKNANIPTMEPVFFAARKIDGDKRAILCSVALDDYTPLEKMVASWKKNGWPDRTMRLRIMQAIAKVMQQMHDHKIQHNCFYPKHIFVRVDENDISIRLIDLEKAKVRPLRSLATFRDLYTLNWHSAEWTRTDRLRFLLIYLGQERLDQKAKQLIHKLQRRILKKGRVHSASEEHR